MAFWIGLVIFVLASIVAERLLPPQYKKFMPILVMCVLTYVNEHSDTLTGISVEEDTIRKYNYPEYISSLIGYTGKISTCFC